MVIQYGGKMTGLRHGVLSGTRYRCCGAQPALSAAPWTQTQRTKDDGMVKNGRPWL